jgi:putative ABC transport system substrate-binding protein
MLIFDIACLKIGTWIQHFSSVGQVMRRRDFVTGIVGCAAAWPLASVAQQLTPVVGFMSSRGPDDSQHLLAAFREGMRTAGFVEGQNVTIKYRWAGGQYDRLPNLAAELVNDHVSLLVATGGEPSVLAAKTAAISIPIVFTTGGDPVRIGLVQSLSHPGGNMTGVSLLTTAPEAKRLGLLRELVPAATVIGALIDPNYHEAQEQAREVVEAGRTMGARIEIAYAGNDRDLESAFLSLADRKASALLVTSDPFFDTRRDRIIELAARFSLPAMYQFREYAAAGGLMSYGTNLADGYRQVGVYAGQVLKGVPPANLPIYQSVKFGFVLNLKTAHALSIEVPPGLSARADEIIE